MRGEEYLGSLRLFGLTDYEARCYMALLTRDLLNAAELSLAARVPYTKIYSTVRNLQNHGFLEVVPDRPQLYRVVPPNVALRNSAQEIEDQHRNRMAMLERLYEEVCHLYEHAEPPHRERDVYLYAGRKSVNAKLQELLSETREDAFMVMALLRNGLELLPALWEARKRGVRIRIMAHPTRNTPEEVVSFKEVAQVRFHPGVSSLLAIFDRDACMQSVGSPIEGPDGQFEHRGVLIRDPAHAMMMYDIYAPCWDGLPEN